MAVVTSDFLAGVLTNFRALFEREFAAAQAFQNWRDISMQMTSTTLTETYNWFGTVPKMEDVTHEALSLQGLEYFNFSITNNLYKAGIEVQRTAFEDDKLGLITPRVQQLGQEAARHPGELVFELFNTNGNAFDGVAFWANTRTLGKSANIDNILTGTGTTVAQIQADLAAARSAMRLFEDDNGRPMNLVGNVIVCPAAIEQAIWQALNANQGSINQPVIPGSADSTLRASGYSVIVNPFLTDPNDWYLSAVRGAFRPFIYQTRLAPALEGITTPNSESGVILDKFIYTARARYNVGYGDPRYSIRTTNT